MNKNLIFGIGAFLVILAVAVLFKSGTVSLSGGLGNVRNQLNVDRRPKKSDETNPSPSQPKKNIEYEWCCEVRGQVTYAPGPERLRNRRMCITAVNKPNRESASSLGRKFAHACIGSDGVWRRQGDFDD